MRVLPVLLSCTLAAAQEPLVERSGRGCAPGGGPPPELLATPPSPGRAVVLACARARAGSEALLALGVAAAVPWSPLPGCEAHVDPRGMLVLRCGLVDGFGVCRVSFSLPADPALLGADVQAQGILWHPGTLDVALTNGLRLHVGARRGPLAALPSPDGAHVAALRALAPGAWIDLGEPTPDPRYGRATGREYTPRMAAAPELGGAFLTGEGGHGYVNPTTQRYVDDVWFYDVRAHAWICVKPGSHVPTIALTLNAEQFEVDAAGELVPVAQLGHGYEFVAFDRVLERFFMQPVPNTYWVGSLGPRRLTWLPDPNFPMSQVTSPWVHDGASGRFLRRPPNAPAPRLATTSRAIAVHWFASRQRILVYDQGAVNRGQSWFYDPLELRWEVEPSANLGPAVLGQVVTCQDATRERLYAYGTESGTGKTKLWFLDLPTRTWGEASATGMPTAANQYTTGFAGLAHDPSSGHVLLRFGAHTVHPYDPTSDQWLAPFDPPATLRPYFRYRHVNAFHDAELDVHVWHVSGSQDQTGRIFAFRY